MRLIDRAEIRRRALRAAMAVSVTGAAACSAPVDAVQGPAAGADTTVEGGSLRRSDTASADGAAETTGRNAPDVAAQDSAADTVDSAADMAAVDVQAPDVAAPDGVALDAAVDAGGDAADAGADGPDAKTGDVADAGPLCDSTQPWDVYKACCDRNGWDWDKGCMAWGPPVPPAMPKARAEVA